MLSRTMVKSNHFHLIVIAMLALLATSIAQPSDGGGGPPGGGGPGGGGNMPSDMAMGTGESASTSCPVLDGSCSDAGSYVDHSLTYDSTTGKLSGTITTNLCPSHSTYGGSDVDCVVQTIPDPAFSGSGAKAAPLLGRLGLTLKEGNNLYGPLDAGFVEGMICDGGECDGGSDLTVCENQLIYQCGEANVNFDLLMDECGGHANPYHHHTDLECDYTATDSSSHSPPIAVSLDGYVVYGKWEGSGEAPVLDACNGHYGPTPADATYGTAASDNVYHYHSSDAPPYMIGCYGPVDSVDECKDLYSTCDDTEQITTFLGLDGSSIDYNLWCPCYQHNGVLATVFGGDADSADDADPTTESSASTLTAPIWVASMALLALAAAL